MCLYINIYINIKMSTERLSARFSFIFVHCWVQQLPCLYGNTTYFLSSNGFANGSDASRCYMGFNYLVITDKFSLEAVM